MIVFFDFSQSRVALPHNECCCHYSVFALPASVRKRPGIKLSAVTCEEMQTWREIGSASEGMSAAVTHHHPSIDDSKAEWCLILSGDSQQHPVALCALRRLAAVQLAVGAILSDCAKFVSFG